MIPVEIKTEPEDKKVEWPRAGEIYDPIITKSLQENEQIDTEETEPEIIVNGTKLSYNQVKVDINIGLTKQDSDSVCSEIAKLTKLPLISFLKTSLRTIISRGLLSDLKNYKINTSFAARLSMWLAELLPKGDKVFFELLRIIWNNPCYSIKLKLEPDQEKFMKWAFECDYENFDAGSVQRLYKSFTQLPRYWSTEMTPEGVLLKEVIGGIISFLDVKIANILKKLTADLGSALMNFSAANSYSHNDVLKREEEAKKLRKPLKVLAGLLKVAKYQEEDMPGYEEMRKFKDMLVELPLMIISCLTNDD